VYKSFECGKAATPMFAAFESPSVAINRKATAAIGRPVTLGGVTINAGDLVCGDEDGLIVIRKEDEDELFRLLDGYLEGNGAFGRLAAAHAIGKVSEGRAAPCVPLRTPHLRPSSHV
jgi:hypothetical protein